MSRFHGGSFALCRGIQNLEVKRSEKLLRLELDGVPGRISNYGVETAAAARYAGGIEKTSGKLRS